MPWGNPNPYASDYPWTGVDVASRLRAGPVSGIEWTLDGKAIPMNAGDAGQEKWRASMVVEGGFDQFAGISVARMLPDGAGQDSVLVGCRPDGSVLWWGQLSVPPKVKEGLVYLVADGPRREWLTRTAPRLYQNRDYTKWASRDGEPFIDPATGEPAYKNDNPIVVDISGGRLLFRIAKGSNVSASDSSGAGLWVPFTGPITRIAFTIDVSSDSQGTHEAAHYGLRLRTAAGPGGALNTQGADVNLTNGAHGSATDRSWSSSDDLVQIILIRNDATNDTNTGALFWVRVYNLRVNGLALTDSYLCSDVISNLAGVVGFDPVTGISSSTLNALPLYWPGGSWLDLALQTAGLEDRRVIVREPALPGGPNLVDYGVFGSAVGRVTGSWLASLERHASEDLNPLRRFNRVIQPYTLGSGVDQIVQASATVDPWGDGRVIEFIADPIPDPQPDGTTPTAAAQSLVDQLAALQLRGSLTIAGLQGADDEAPARPDELQAGDLVTIPDMDPVVPPQRVVAVDYTPGEVRATIGQDVTIAGLVTNLQNARARRRVPPRRR